MKRLTEVDPYWLHEEYWVSAQEPGEDVIEEVYLRLREFENTGYAPEEIKNMQPVRHGRWIVQKVDDIRTKFYCSECERCVWCGNDHFMKPTEYVAHVYPYCHCGAKMDGGLHDAQK